MATTSDKLFNEYAGVLWEGELGRDIARDIVAFVAKHVAPPEPVVLTPGELGRLGSAVVRFMRPEMDGDEIGYARRDANAIATVDAVLAWFDANGFDIVRRRA